MSCRAWLSSLLLRPGRLRQSRHLTPGRSLKIQRTSTIRSPALPTRSLPARRGAACLVQKSGVAFDDFKSFSMLPGVMRFSIVRSRSWRRSSAGSDFACWSYYVQARTAHVPMLAKRLSPADQPIFSPLACMLPFATSGTRRAASQEARRQHKRKWQACWCPPCPEAT